MNIKDINNNKKTYQGCDIKKGSPLKTAVKRAGRKLTFWYIDPFGENQNNFNQKVYNALQEVDDALKDFYNENQMLKKELKEMRLELQEVKESSIINEKTNLESIEMVNHYIAEINPEARKGVREKNYKELSLQSVKLNRAITEIKRLRNDSRAMEDKLLWVEKEFLESANEGFKSIENRKDNKTIVIVCMGLSEFKGLEAIKNEVYDLYHLLKTKSIYNIRLISIESDYREVIKERDIIYTPIEQLKDTLKVFSASLFVICESSADIMRVNDCAMLMKHSIIKLSGQNPLFGLSDGTLNELRHLNDFGLHKYYVESKTAYKIMVDNGFKEPILSYPLIDLKKDIFSHNRKAFVRNDKFVVGFASSPMLEGQLADRGIPLLIEIVQKAKDINFKILWRNVKLEVPIELTNAENCEIVLGRYDMQKFYSEADCVIIPYTSIDNNHACSLSGIEAMMNGIPVVSTEISGISEMINSCGMGEIKSQNSDELLKGINDIRANYMHYAQGSNIEKLRKYIENRQLISMIEKEAKREIPNGIVTLYEWDRLLKQNEMYLVKGQDSMREYYRSQAVADKYTVHRFTTYPHNCFDLMERKSIGIILSDYFKRNDLDILDIACGDGRIIQENILHGHCIATDSSNAMLGLVKERFSETPEKVETIQGDFFETPMETKFDVITTFRYIRHFEYAKRKQLYNKIKANLKSDGLLIFDVPNINLEVPLKVVTGWDKYNIYDVFWDKQSIIDEMEHNGFEIKYIIPVGYGLMEQVENTSEPMTWTIAVKIK